MIYAKRIVPELNRFYRGHIQNTPNLKTFFGYACGMRDFLAVLMVFARVVWNKLFFFFSIFQLIVGLVCGLEACGLRA